MPWGFLVIEVVQPYQFQFATVALQPWTVSFFLANSDTGNNNYFETFFDGASQVTSNNDNGVFVQRMDWSANQDCPPSAGWQPRVLPGAEITQRLQS